MDKGLQDCYLRGQQIARDRAVREIRAAAGRSRCKCARETLERLADKVEAQELKTLADGAGQGSPEEKEGEEEIRFAVRRVAQQAGV